MGTLIKFELRKLYRNRLNQIVFIGGCLLMFGIMLLSVIHTRGEDREGNPLSGLEAISYDRQLKKELAGPLTDERVGEIIKEYQEVMDNPDNRNEEGELKEDVLYDYYKPMSGLLTGIGHNYDEVSNCSVGEYLSFGGILLELPLEGRQDFYEAGRERLLNKMLMAADWTYSKAEQNFWLSKAEKVATPIEYGYSGGWERINECIGMFIIALIALAVLLARVYTLEYESGAENVILTTKYGKTKVAAAKNIAALIFGGMFCLINLLLPYAVFLPAFGAEGGNLPIQAGDLQIPYPFTYMQADLLYSGACLVMAFGVMALVLFLSARMKTALPVLSGTLVLLFAGMVFKYSDTNGIQNHIACLLPYNAVPLLDLYSLIDYPFGKLILDYPSMIYLVYFTFGVLLLLFAGRAFNRHEAD